MCESDTWEREQQRVLLQILKHMCIYVQMNVRQKF